MDYISSTIHEYQPILVGAGCLALGYMYGRHCRCVMEPPGGTPKTSDAACCAGTEVCNYVSEPAVDPETMAMVRQWLNPAEADWDSSDREATEKPETNAKRDDGQLETLPTSKDNMLWNHIVFKKQKSAPVRREAVRAKGESEQGSDGEPVVSRTRASVTDTRPRERREEWKHASKDVATSCEAKEGEGGVEVAMGSPRKGPARSVSGLGALAAPHDGGGRDDGEDESSPPGSSVEDTCRSPRTEPDVGCEEHCGDEEEDDDDEEEDKDGADGVDELDVNCEAGAFASSAAMSAGCFAGLQCRAALALALDADATSSARMEVDARKEADDFMRLELPTLPTSPPPELLHEDEGELAMEEERDGKPAIVHMADGGEKRNKTSARSFLGKTKPIQFRWLKKIWKTSNMWKRRNKSKQGAIPTRTEASKHSGLSHKHQKSNSNQRLA